jgi:hypothetical protein
MSFVRRKRINGRVYLYRVENRWEGGRVRQVVLEYLGAEDPVPRRRPPSEAVQEARPRRKRAGPDKT